MDAKNELKLILDALGEHKVEDVTSIDVHETSPFASYVIIGTCGNPRMLGAIQGHLEDALEKGGVPVTVKEGEPDSGWVIVQGEEVIVHLMLPGNRRMVDLESLLEKIAKKAS
ncbi:MAG: ribosome silencing factor [Erysipelotrichaceae bacterium]|nr:ribosome silencing factor [Erysipelotrichaceae bacterium]